jgi:tRNA (cytidine/uridine-2'-O-)-methyltransferase
MFNIVLYQPEIPPNTGNIIRLCANTGCCLQLVEPLGFDMNNKKLRRAGLDYHEWAAVKIQPDLTSACGTGDNIYAISTRGTRSYTDAYLNPGDTLVFGPETRGLPDSYLDTLDQDRILRIPMLKHSRSLNLSNAVAVVVYEGLRQNNFTDETA